MSTYKYDVSAIHSDINRLNALAQKEPADLKISTQNVGDMINKVQELVPQLNALHKALNGLILATAQATQATLNQMLQTDENFSAASVHSQADSPLIIDIR